MFLKLKFTFFVVISNGASCPWGELSMGRVVHGASCPCGKLSLGQVVHGASCPWGELSWGESELSVGRVVREPDGQSGLSHPGHPFPTSFTGDIGSSGGGTTQGQSLGNVINLRSVTTTSLGQDDNVSGCV